MQVVSDIVYDQHALLQNMQELFVTSPWQLRLSVLDADPAYDERET